MLNESRSFLFSNNFDTTCTLHARNASSSRMQLLANEDRLFQNRANRITTNRCSLFLGSPIYLYLSPPPLTGCNRSTIRNRYKAYHSILIKYLIAEKISFFNSIYFWSYYNHSNLTFFSRINTCTSTPLWLFRFNFRIKLIFVHWKLYSLEYNDNFKIYITNYK